MRKARARHADGGAPLLPPGKPGLLPSVLFDGNTKDANLIGIEYIVSERLFGSLPDEEKPYWHPHNYEVLSGQLCAPGLPEAAERALMKELLNSYGKTWHTWHTGRHDGVPGDRLPLGDPKLMWSFNRDGEADEGLKANFEQHMGVDELSKRGQRQAFVELAHPQRGVDDMAAEFTGTTPIPGVVDATRSKSGAPEGAPHMPMSGSDASSRVPRIDVE